MRRLSERTWKRGGWLFGVVTPLLCIALDPGLFKANESTEALFPLVASFFYGATLISIVVLSIALARDCMPPFSRGVVLFGALLASAMSALLVPLALLLVPMGAVAALGGKAEPLDALVSFLGLTPVATAVVYWRYFLRADEPRTVAASVASLLGTAFAFSVPAGINLGAVAVADPCMERVVGAPGEASLSDIRCVERLAFTTDFSPFFWAYGNADSKRQAELRDVYLRITGRDLERDAVPSD